jgi:hypothetical protein
MHRNFRLVFFVLGLLIIICSLAALAFAFGAVEMISEITPLAPTLFAPP